MSPFLQAVQPLTSPLSLLFLGAGLLLWFWGTWPMLEAASYLSKLHKLSVADTLGSTLMLLGLLLRIPGQWPLLCLALLGLMVWNTIFGYVLARCSLPPQGAGTARPRLPSPTFRP